MTEGTIPPRPPAGGGDDRRRAHLGRGLTALLGDDQAKGQAGPALATRSLPIEQLRPGKYQPRHRFDDDAFKSLVDSVKEKGILQPILVRRDPQAPHLYEIVAGERRWRAAQQAQLHEVPVVVRDLADRDALEFALVENIQREDLTPIEEAQGYQRLMEEFGHTQEALARAVGKSRSHIANQLRLLSLPKAVQDMVQAGALRAGHARALIGVPNVEALAQEVVAKGFNVRQTERRVRLARPMPPRKGVRRDAPVAKDADTLAIEHELSNLLGLRVTIHFRKSGGELVIHYETLDQLDDVLRRISGTAPHPKAP
jgi:ParB family chromosome partitioning protein